MKDVDYVMAFSEEHVDKEHLDGFLDGLYLAKAILVGSQSVSNAIITLNDHIEAAKRLNKSLKEVKE